jgi:putative transposase
MPYRKEPFQNGEIYHIVTRRIGNDLLFKIIDDYYRGVFSIYEFNNSNPVEIRKRREARAAFKKKLKKMGGDRVSAPAETEGMIDKRDKFVEILAFCLMPNHVHLLLKQLKENGISNFMQKFGAGYSAYFKNKYDLKRKGHFFQERFVAVRIKTDEQLKAVFVYIHTNSISLVEPKWKEIGIKNPEKAIKFVENYKWSSYLDYVGKKNFPSLTERDFLLEVMGGPQGCKEFVKNWIRYKGEIKKFPRLALEE